jgi:hypothetical protein
MAAARLPSSNIVRENKSAISAGEAKSELARWTNEVVQGWRPPLLYKTYHGTSSFRKILMTDKIRGVRRFIDWAAGWHWEFARGAPRADCASDGDCNDC